ncbi:MAG: ABC transporter ATP-binding protein [Acidimicrobiales bacterium]|nr:ABC transporter ATP-binding protein [Acidimicrobiales bacterium]
MTDVLEVREVGVRFAGIVALDDLTFSIQDGNICALIGPNGAGKTTLFNVISRLYEPTTGHVTFDGNDLLETPAHRIAAVGIARTFQNLALFPSLTVLQNVMVGAHTRGRTNWVTGALRIGVKKEDSELEQLAFATLDELGLASVALKPAAGLPYGTMKRIELARSLVGRPKLLMLDEPASGLTHSEVDDLADVIRQIRATRNITVLLVEHHMQMVMGIADHIVVLNFGRKLAEGAPKDIAKNPAVVEAYLGATA